MPRWQDILCKGGAYLSTARITVKSPIRDFPKIRRKKNLLLLRPITAEASSICRNRVRRMTDAQKKKRETAPKLSDKSRADAMRRRAMIQVHAADRLCLMRRHANRAESRNTKARPASRAIPASHADHASRRSRHAAVRLAKIHARPPESSRKSRQRICFSSVRRSFCCSQRRAIISLSPSCLSSL